MATQSPSRRIVAGDFMSSIWSEPEGLYAGRREDDRRFWMAWGHPSVDPSMIVRGVINDYGDLVETAR